MLSSHAARAQLGSSGMRSGPIRGRLLRKLSERSLSSAISYVSKGGCQWLASAQHEGINYGAFNSAGWLRSMSRA